jgi:hypothetical protein
VESELGAFTELRIVLPSEAAPFADPGAPKRAFSFSWSMMSLMSSRCSAGVIFGLAGSS